MGFRMTKMTGTSRMAGMSRMTRMTGMSRMAGMTRDDWDDKG